MTDHIRRLIGDSGARFHVVNTGGGCLAYHRDIGENYALLTDCDAGLPESLTETAVVGLYTGDGEPIATLYHGPAGIAARMFCALNGRI